MTQFLFANNAVSTLAAPIGPFETTAVLASGTGSLFPNPGAGQAFAITFQPAAGGGNNEIAYCTARSGDSLTISRAEEGSANQAWSVNDTAQNLITAGALASFGQSGSGSNFAVDTGTANALVASLSVAPGSLAALVGIPVLIQKGGAANTAAMTLALNGLASTSVTHADASAIGAGEWPQNGIGLVVLNEAATEFQLLSIMTQPATLSEFTSDMASSGWNKLPDGIIEQWGTGGTTSGSGNIVFPLTFPNGPFAGSAIVGVTGSAPAAPDSAYVDISSVTTTGMNIFSAAGTSIGVTYRVKGH